MTSHAAVWAGVGTEDALARAQAGDEAGVFHLARAQAGDESAFSDLVRQHQAMVFGLAIHFLRRHAEAEDLAQDVFVALHQNLARMESEAHVRFWLCTVTSRRCIDRARRLSWRLERITSRMPDPPVLPEHQDPLLAAMLKRLV